MGKVKRNYHSLKWSMAFYLPACLIFAVLGTYLIGFGTNDLQDWYEARHSDLALSSDLMYEIRMLQQGKAKVVRVSPESGPAGLYSYTDRDGRKIYAFPEGEHAGPGNLKYFIVYWIISNAQIVLIPLWVILCIAVTGFLFYNRELKKPICLLMDASGKIAENQLNFKIEYKKQNELGTLCTAFDRMRSALYENNLEMWRSLEERKRLNSAFSHDIRTPLTVLKGYADFLEKYVPDGRVTEEKLLSVISMIKGQILRLEHYAEKMNAVQKLEDLVPAPRRSSEEELYTGLRETGKMICGEKFRLRKTPGTGEIFVDLELVMQVYENLIANALQYAEQEITVDYQISEQMLKVSVRDDGKGFTEEALKHAAQPFFRDEKEPDRTHFGLGLYICRILCEKCGGALTVENWERGGKVTAEFFCG